MTYDVYTDIDGTVPLTMKKLCMTRDKPRFAVDAVQGERLRRTIGMRDGGEVLTLMVDTGHVCGRNIARVAYSDG